jgi:pimeloyl-ACP methyl ester carboxylesterase
VLPAAVLAGHGYILLAPDYLGYGVSDEPHHYYVTANMAAVVRDFLEAAQQVLAGSGFTGPMPLLIAGFSEGGHATLATQRLLERAPLDGFVLCASAPIAAAVDLADLGLGRALRGESRFASLYIAWLALSYARAYCEDISSVLDSPWDLLSPDMFDGKHDGDSIVAALPADPRDLFNRAFMAARERGESHWFLSRLRENSILEWRPSTPTRCYFGTLDVDVGPEQSELLQRLSGESVAAVSVGEVDHEKTVGLAAPLLRDWFDEVAASFVPQTHADS